MGSWDVNQQNFSECTTFMSMGANDGSLFQLVADKTLQIPGYYNRRCGGSATQDAVEELDKANFCYLFGFGVDLAGVQLVVPALCTATFAFSYFLFEPLHSVLRMLSHMKERCVGLSTSFQLYNTLSQWCVAELFKIMPLE